MCASLPEDIPVLVVGSGPTGLLAANLLGTYGIDTLLVERNAGTSSLPKAILIDDEGLRALQAVGLVDEVLDLVIAGYGARYYAPDGDCFAQVDAPVTENGFHRRNAFLQPDLEQVMQRGLARFGSVRSCYRTALTGLVVHDDHVDAVLRPEDGDAVTVKCAHVLACDGGRSTVRDLLGIAMTGRTDSRDWVVVDALNDPDEDRFSKFFCDPARPMVSIPAPGRGRRYEYMVMPDEDPQAMAAPARIAEVLARFRRLAPQDILRGAVYTFHARIAERLAWGRVLLMGDAAHLTPPFAGQGMNAGLRDSFNVAWKVALAIRGAAPPDIIASYEVERRGPIIEMIDYAVALGAIVMPTGRFGMADRLAIKAALAGDLTDGRGLAIRAKPQAVYGSGWLCPVSFAAHGTLVGRPLPQALVRGSDGAVSRLDDVLGPGFAVVGIGRACSPELGSPGHSTWERLGARRLLVLGRGEAADRACRAVDAVEIAGDDHRGLMNQHGQLLVVRPDRFVMGQCDAGRLGELTHQVALLVAGKASQARTAGSADGCDFLDPSV